MKRIWKYVMLEYVESTGQKREIHSKFQSENSFKGHKRAWEGKGGGKNNMILTFRSRNYFLILAHPVYKM